MAYSGFLFFPKVNMPTFVRLILHLMVTLGSGTRIMNAILFRPTPTSGMATSRDIETSPHPPPLLLLVARAKLLE
jgi:hypothetical protein